MAEPLPDYAINLRRLFAWHLQSNQEVAAALGASENSVSGWLTGKRPPGGEYLTRIGTLYAINPAKMMGDPEAFGLEIADPNRYHEARESLAAARRK
jgi:transcriptional regulator with XRE-family HTH domain